MAEIKSTLDIIMEKTKNLTLTEEERRTFKRREMEGKVKGLIQRFIEGAIHLERFKFEVASLVEEDERTVREIINDEIAGRFELESDNEVLLDILESAISMDTSGIKKSLAECQRKVAQQRSIREKALLENFKKKGISGSAVIPNINADSEWKDYLGKMKKTFNEEIMRKMR